MLTTLASRDVSLSIIKLAFRLISFSFEVGAFRFTHFVSPQIREGLVSFRFDHQICVSFRTVSFRGWRVSFRPFRFAANIASNVCVMSIVSCWKPFCVKSCRAARVVLDSCVALIVSRAPHQVRVKFVSCWCFVSRCARRSH